MKKTTTFQLNCLLGTLLMVLTTALPAWAQTPVSLSIDNDYTPDQDGYYYVNMTEFGILDIDDPSIVFKIYDDGGKNGGIMMREQKLVIQAPEEYVFELTGRILDISGDGLLSAFDGDKVIDPILFNYLAEVNTDIGTHTTTANLLRINFSSNYTNRSGFELTVRLKPAPKFNINFNQIDGGTWTVVEGDNPSLGRKTIGLEFTSSTNRTVSTVKAYKTGDENTEVELTKIDETHYSFTMPFYDVTIEPSPYDWLWTSGNTTCRLDNAGTFTVKAVEGTNGAMANYPTIEAPWQSHMSEIKKLVIDPSVTVIGSYTFLNFPLAEITLPEGLEKIRTGAFRYANLTKVTIPATMVSISAEAFYCCDQLTDVYCFAPAEQLTWGKSMWDFIHNPDYWTYATRLHVRQVHLEAYKSKFEGKLNVTIEGDLVPTDNWTDEGNYASQFSVQNDNEKYIRINSEAEMARLAYLVNKGHQTFNDYYILLDCDLNMERHNWIPIGDGNNIYSYKTPFMGTFDGQGHTISGINVNRSGQNYNGLFGWLGRLDDSTPVGRLRSLRLTNSTIIGGNYTGGLVGYLYFGTVTDCFTDATVRGGSYTGGLVGYTEGSTSQLAEITDCLYMGSDVSGDANSTRAVVGGGTGERTLKAFYTNLNTTGKTNHDILALPTYYDETGDVSLTLNNDGRVVFDGVSYCATNGSETFTISAANNIEVGSVTINGVEVGSGAGTYTIEVEEGATECRIALSTDLLMLDQADNTTVISQRNGKSYNVVLRGRTLFRDGSWNTLCLPFDVNDLSGTPLEGATIMTLGTASFNEGTLTLNFVNATYIEAGKPYIVRWTSADKNLSNPRFANVIVKEGLNDITAGVLDFKGLYAPLSIGESGDQTLLYLGTANKLYYPNGAMSINACRAYFRLNDGLVCGEPTTGTDNVNTFTLNFNGETTGLNYQFSTPDAQHSAWYTLEGVRISVPSNTSLPKGVYINNGRKVVIHD